VIEYSLSIAVRPFCGRVLGSYFILPQRGKSLWIFYASNFILQSTFSLSFSLFAQANSGNVVVTGKEAPDTTELSKTNIDVTVAYSETTGQDTSPVYNVQVQWGSLLFYYQKTTGSTWDPSAVAYTGASADSYEWVCPTDSSGARNDQVTVTNRSNRAVACALTYSQSRNDATISLENDSYTLASAVGAKEGNLPKGVTTVHMGGTFTGDKAAEGGFLYVNIVPVDSTEE
jgi:hypothetical protein